MIPLTPRQRDYFNFIKTCIDREGVAPTLREIGAAMGSSTGTAFKFVQELVVRGHLRRTSKRQSIELVDNTLPTHEEWERITAMAANKMCCRERSAGVVMRAIGGR